MAVRFTRSEALRWGAVRDEGSLSQTVTEHYGYHSLSRCNRVQKLRLIRRMM